MDKDKSLLEKVDEFGWKMFNALMPYVLMALFLFFIRKLFHLF